MLTHILTSASKDYAYGLSERLNIRETSRPSRCTGKRVVLAREIHQTAASLIVAGNSINPTKEDVVRALLDYIDHVTVKCH